jgi:hypothetical protein
MVGAEGIAGVSKRHTLWKNLQSLASSVISIMVVEIHIRFSVSDSIFHGVYREFFY